MDDPWGPLAARNDAGVGPEQTEQAQGRRLLHHVQSVAESDVKRKFIIASNSNCSKKFKNYFWNVLFQENLKLLPIQIVQKKL